MDVPSASARLEAALLDVAEANKPTPRDLEKRLQVIQAVRSSLQELPYVKIDVLPYGSFVSGFYKSSSDLDLALVASVHVNTLTPRQLNEMRRAGHSGDFVPLGAFDKTDKAPILRKAALLLRNRQIPRGYSMQYILHARVPIINFKDAWHDIECDLCIGDNTTAFKASVMRQVALINPRFGGLFRLVKAWAKAHGINNGADSTFNSWCLGLVVIFYMQMRPAGAMLPSLVSLFYAETPGPDAVRLLALGSTVDVAVAHGVLEQRVRGAAAEFGHVGSDVSLSALFTDFVNTTRFHLTECLKSPESLRCASVWHGCLTVGKFGRAFALMVEDPFDASDNVARTFGCLDMPPTSLGFVHSVFEATGGVLADARDGQVDLDTAIAWLFGHWVLTEVPALVPSVFSQEMAAWAAREVQRAREAEIPDRHTSTPQAAIANAANAAARAAHDSFRALLGAVQCNYPLPTLDDYRHAFLRNPDILPGRALGHGDGSGGAEAKKSSKGKKQREKRADKDKAAPAGAADHAAAAAGAAPLPSSSGGPPAAAADDAADNAPAPAASAARGSRRHALPAAAGSGVVGNSQGARPRSQHTSSGGGGGAPAAAGDAPSASVQGGAQLHGGGGGGGGKRGGRSGAQTAAHPVGSGGSQGNGKAAAALAGVMGGMAIGGGGGGGKLKQARPHGAKAAANGAH
ncbi:hypothetical protein FOA52_002358 [Chlamydomonas sp. UWO 241]|nr:hypothetical protein FOA52_002358 [Chlamydomonas sp. UWO 241]